MFLRKEGKSVSLHRGFWNVFVSQTPKELTQILNYRQNFNFLSCINYFVHNTLLKRLSIKTYDTIHYCISESVDMSTRRSMKLMLLQKNMK